MNIIHSGRLIGKTKLLELNNYSIFNRQNLIIQIKNIKSQNIKSQNIKSQNIITNKNNMFCEKDTELYLHNNQFIKDKKLISISPAGIKGFYLFGVLNYIKQNYDLSDYIFSGASAGSWNSLFMCLNKNSDDFVYQILNSELKKSKTINELEYSIKYKILNTYKEEDFDLNRLFIGVTSIKNYQIQTNIFSDFDNLEDAINCCIASSHIPLITGGLSNKYHDIYSFDGGFSIYPYLNVTKSALHVYPNMWSDYHLKRSDNKNDKLKNNIQKFLTYSSFLFMNKNTNFIELYDNGYADAKTNKNILDTIFIVEKNSNISEIIDYDIYNEMQ